MISPFDLVLQSFDLFKKQAKLFWVYVILYIIPTFGVLLAKFYLAPEALAGGAPVYDADYIVYRIIALVAGILSLLVTIAFIESIVEAHEGRTPVGPFRAIAANRKHLLHAVIATILFSLAVVGGLLLLVIPGIFFAIWFYFVVFEVLFNDKTALQSFRSSKTLTRGREWDVFLRIAIPLLLYIIGARFALWLIILPFANATHWIALIIAVIIALAIALFFLALTIISQTILYLDVRRLGSKKPSSTS